MSIAAPIDMLIFQGTIHTWFINATDLVTIWSNQSAPKPDYPYAMLQITNGPRPLAPQWEIRRSTDLGRPAGQEIEYNYHMPCQFDISCQAYIDMENARDPNKNAVWYLNKAQTALSLLNVQTTLAESNVTYINTSEVQQINEVFGDAYKSRANIDVTFGTVLSALEYHTYIERVQIVSSSFGVDTIVGG